MLLPNLRKLQGTPLYLTQVNRLAVVHSTERVGERAERLTAAKRQPPLGTALPFADALAKRRFGQFVVVSLLQPGPDTCHDRPGLRLTQCQPLAVGHVPGAGLRCRRASGSRP